MSGAELLNTYTSDVAALTAGTIDSTQSLTVRSPDTGSKIRLIGVWRKGTVAGPLRVRSNRMHDDVQGLRLESGAAQAINALRYGAQTPLVGNDKLTIESYDTATTNANVLALIYYDSIAGSDGNFSTWAQIEPRVQDLMGVSIDVAAGATLSEYSAGDTLDNANNLMKADTQYAILGYECENTVAGIAIAGPCTGSLKYGGPGQANALHTGMWFAELSRMTGLATIPVMKQADKGNTFLYQVDNAAGATNTVTLLCARLSA